MAFTPSTSSEPRTAMVARARRHCFGWVVLALLGLGSEAGAQEAPALDPDRAAPAPAGGETAETDRLETERPARGKPEKPWNRDVPLETRKAASKLFDEGYSFLTVPLFSQAAEKFAEALTLYQHPAIYFNLALSQLNLVQPVEAYESFDRAMAYGPEAIGEVPYGRAKEYRRRLEQQLGHLEIVCDQDGAEVTLDGRPIFTGPGRFEGVVVPGEHQILASKAGYLPATERVVVSAGERMEVALTLRLPERTVTERYMPAWIPWAGLAVGATVLGLGGYFDRTSSRALNELDAELQRGCSRGCTDVESPGLTARVAELEHEQTTALRLYIAGGAAVAISAALLYVNRERVVRRETRADSITVMPMTRSHTLGLTAWLRF